MHCRPRLRRSARIEMAALNDVRSRGSRSVRPPCLAGLTPLPPPAGTFDLVTYPAFPTRPASCVLLQRRKRGVAEMGHHARLTRLRRPRMDSRPGSATIQPARPIPASMVRWLNQLEQQYVDPIGSFAGDGLRRSVLLPVIDFAQGESPIARFVRGRSPIQSSFRREHQRAHINACDYALPSRRAAAGVRARRRAPASVHANAGGARRHVEAGQRRRRRRGDN